MNKCSGNGAGSCKACNDKGIWNDSWICFLYHIDGFEGCYCIEHAKELEQRRKQMKDELVKWLKDWFDENGKDCSGVVGISGGKDSSVVAALCVEALGKDRVIGVLMPDGDQSDIDYSHKLVNHLGIKHITVNIADTRATLVGTVGVSIPDNLKDIITLTDQAKFNLPPRLRMSTLYFISQCCNGRVMNTCNLSETLLGWETRWGDAVGDVAPLADLTVQEVKQLGYELGLPKELIEKVPSDGLCGSSDEEKMGIKYSVLDEYIRTGICKDKEMQEKIDSRIKANLFKHTPIPKFESNLSYFNEVMKRLRGY